MQKKRSKICMMTDRISAGKENTVWKRVKEYE